jgi:hypothetical protein
MISLEQPMEEVGRSLRDLARSSFKVTREVVSGRPSGMSAPESFTVQMGFAIVLAALSVGMQVGQWPDWTIAVGVLGYFAWTVLYAEVVVRARLLTGSAPQPESHPG